MKNTFEKFGVLISCTGGAAMNVASIKELIDAMQKMGYNYLEMGIENYFKVEGEPYIGYLHGRYSKAEIKEIEDYAESRGITLAPCIQTLAHMDVLLDRPQYEHLRDIGGVLLVDEPKTYELLDKIFKTLREYFKTDLVNVGMDEAHFVGLGKYLDKHGFVNRKELLSRHLEKVVALAKKHGFKPHMWSDMYFKLEHNVGYYPPNPKLSQQTLDEVPKDIGLCYWDYGEHELKEEIFDDMFAAHEDFNRELWFAGGAWCWNGFAPFNRFSLRSMEMAIRQAQKHRVKNVMITLWGNDGGECPYISVLPSLYAMSEYAKGNYDEKQIAAKFATCFGVDFYDFMLLDLPNKTSRNDKLELVENACKSLFYSDVFLGFEDYPLSKLERIPFDEYARTLKTVGKRMGKYEYLFDNLSRLCDALAIKADLGLRTRNAYQQGDRANLKALTRDYKKCIARIDDFYQSYRRIWLATNKPYGWELQSVRFAGLTERLKDCRVRILDYLSGKIDCIPELEEKLLPYVDEWGINFNSWRGLISLG